MKLGDVSGRIAREYFVAEVLDEFFIPVRASGYDFVAFFAKLLVRDVHVTEVIPEWRIFAQGPKGRFPLILQNVHRYFFVLAALFNLILAWDAILGFRNGAGQWGHAGLGTLVLVANATLLWLYTASCHSCRHIMGGRLKHFSKHPVRYKAWGVVSRLNARHMQLAWVSLFSVAIADLYVLLVASNAFSDPRFF